MYDGKFDPALVTAKPWQFARGDGSVIAERLFLRADGTLQGYSNYNESRWAIADDRIAFLDGHGNVTTIFESLAIEDAMFVPKVVLRGHFKTNGAIHILKEISALDLKIQDVAETVVAHFAKDLLGRNHDCFNVVKVAEMVAAYDAARYYSTRMRTARVFSNKEDLLCHALSLCTIEGLVLEFGVATGHTLNLIASQVRSRIYGFDVFTGLPETWRPGFEAGAFAQALPEVRSNAELVVGLFEDTLPGFLLGHPGPVSFLHVDCDLYSSSKTIFRELGNAIVTGTVIVFDEYFNYPGWEQDEYKAFQEFLVDRNLSYCYAGLVENHQQVCVVIA